MELTVRDLTVEYASGGYPVRPIDGLDLDVGAGELVLLLGASGCGKTTLLSVLAAILKPLAGSVKVGDVEVGELHGEALAAYRRHTVGIVFQAFNLIPSLTARENVQVAMRLGGHQVADSRGRALALLGQVGLSDRVDHRPGDLSGGQQQRVAIARALANDPPLLLADEPTAHLDYIQVESVLRLIRAVADEGRMVVISTHDERMIPLADRVIALTAPMAGAVTHAPTARTLAAGEVLFRQGDPGDLVYTVDDGRIELVRSLADGGEELLTSVTAGGYFGELAPLFGLRRAAAARAAEPSVVTAYTVRDFRERVHRGTVSQLLTHASDADEPVA
jgi:putative ABC transport system ATP-binding protein